MDPPRQARTAATYPVPSTRLVSVEHPAIIRNLDKALDTLHGNAGINKLMNPAKADESAKLTLRPEDAMARPLLSTSCPSNNVLLKITMPKRTGRKRKRGTDAPFTDATPEDGPEPQRRTSKDLLRSLQDNPSRYQAEPVGKVERTHLFRGMPGFVYSTTNSAFTQRFRDQILPYDLEKLKEFDLDMAKGAMENADIIPPPSLSNEQVPFVYMYRQTPGVKQLRDASGRLITTNTQRPEKVRTHLLPHNIPEVPSKPQEGLPPIETLDPALQDTIKLLAGLFERRPAWTRRAIRNFLQTDEQRYLLRLAVPYVGYIFRSGPWRDAIIKLGLDPRKDPEFRHYQTFMFRLIPREPEIYRDGASRRGRYVARYDPEVSGPIQGQNTYIFTGDLPMQTDGRIWMVCDIADPYIRNLLYPPESVPREEYLRDTCDVVSDGWFANGLLAKVKIIMRSKISSLMEGFQPSNEDFFQIVSLPNFASTDAELHENFQLDPRTSSTKEIGLATEMRAAIKSAPTWIRGNRDDPVSPEKGKAVKIKDAATSKTQETGVNQDEIDESQSEGEEEEMERAEMVADALAAREAAENEANLEQYQDQDDEEGEDEDGDEDEDEDDDDDDDDDDDEDEDEDEEDY